MDIIEKGRSRENMLSLRSQNNSWTEKTRTVKLLKVICGKDAIIGAPFFWSLANANTAKKTPLKPYIGCASISSSAVAKNRMKHQAEVPKVLAIIDNTK